MLTEKIAATIGQMWLAGLAVNPEAMATRIDTGSDSPVFRRQLGLTEVAVQVYLDRQVNWMLLRNLTYETKRLAQCLNGTDTDYVWQMQRVKISFDDDKQEPWRWRVNPVIKFGVTWWEGEPRGFMIKPFIDGPCLADRDYPDKDLVCAQVARGYYGGRTQGRVRVVPANVRLDFDRRELVIIKPYTKLIKY
jgi:hypothetical protein